MEQINTYISKAILLNAFLIISLNSYSQRLGIKPFVGIQHNNSSLVYERGVLPFTIVNQNEVRAVYGLLISYQLNPKWGIETSIQSSPSVISYSMYNPASSGTIIGSLTETIRFWQYQFNASYTLKQMNQYNRLKGLAGFTIYDLSSGMRTFNPDNYYNTDFIKLSSGVGAIEYNNFEKYSYGLMLGLGNDFMIKNKVIAEARLTARYNINPIMGAYSVLKFQGKEYTNEYVANRLSFNAVLLVN